MRFGGWWELSMDLFVWLSSGCGSSPSCPGAVSLLWSCLLFQSSFLTTAVLPGGEHPGSDQLPWGREKESDWCARQTRSSPLLSFYPFWASKKFSTELPLCLLDYSFHFSTSSTYFLLSKDFSLFLDPLRASLLGLRPHLKLIFFLLYFSIIFRDSLWKRRW